MALRKRWIFGLAAGAGLLTAAAFAAVLVPATGGHKPAIRVNVSAVKLGSAQLARLERGLTAPEIAAQATVVAAEIRAQFIARGRPLLPAGSRVDIQPATFDARSTQTATVDASVSDPKPARWQLLLIKEGGNWLLIGTRGLP